MASSRKIFLECCSYTRNMGTLIMKQTLIIIIIAYSVYYSIECWVNLSPSIKYDKNKALVDYGEVVLAKFAKKHGNDGVSFIYGIVIHPHDPRKGVIVLQNNIVELSHEVMSVVIELKNHINRECPACGIKPGIDVYYLYIYDIDHTYTISKNEYCISHTLKSYRNLSKIVGSLS